MVLRTCQDVDDGIGGLELSRYGEGGLLVREGLEYVLVYVLLDDHLDHLYHVRAIMVSGAF
jgi:hypothetical protein